jgi:hypothetical protein
MMLLEVVIACFLVSGVSWGLEKGSVFLRISHFDENFSQPS